MNTLEWKHWNMCGVQATLVNGETVIVDGYQSGKESGFALTYRYGTYRFSDRANAYAAAELLNTALYLERAA